LNIEGEEINNPVPESLNYVKHDPIYIMENEDLIPENGISKGNGTQSNPFIIEGWEIDASNSHGIEIIRTDLYLIVRNNYIHSGNSSYNGVRLSSVSNCIIANNKMTNNYDGIYLTSSHNNFITGNILIANIQTGIYLDGSRHNEVQNNEVSQNDWKGIYLKYSRFNRLLNNNVNRSSSGIHLVSSDNNDLIENNVTKIDHYGILLDASSNTSLKLNSVSKSLYGIYVRSSIDRGSNYNILEHNRLYENNNYGIKIQTATKNIVRYNLIEENFGYGIYVYDSGKNQIYNNNFIDNNIIWYKDQAFDNKNNNLWNFSYPVGGNYWSGYYGDDTFEGINQDVDGSDGICDEPFTFDEDNIDSYPLMEMWKPEIPWKPDGFRITIINSSFNLSWNYPSYDGGFDILNYRIYRGISKGNESLLVEINNVLFYNDKGINESGTYYYYIIAVNNLGEGHKTESINATIIITNELPENIPDELPDGLPDEETEVEKSNDIISLITRPVNIIILLIIVFISVALIFVLIKRKRK
jgi:parallel beta-helix repeat protein